MIYLIVGPSCAGKSSYVTNTYVKGSAKCREFKDLLTVCETDKAYLIGKYMVDERRRGSDTISIRDIPKIYDQLIKLDGRGKDVVIEGCDKLPSGKLFERLAESGHKCKLILINCSLETSKARNAKNPSSVPERTMKAFKTRSENIYNKFSGLMESQIINTDNVEDFSKFNADTAVRSSAEIKSGEMKHKKFCIFIMSNGRADNVITVNILKRYKCSVPWYIIIDNLDKTGDEYRKNYGEEHILMFDKPAFAKRVDTGTNSQDLRSVVYARHSCWDFAKMLGMDYFLMLEDDYTGFYTRYKDGDTLKAVQWPTNLESLFDCMLDFLDACKVKTVAMAQGGDYIGGVGGEFWRKGIARKAMNTFFCRTDNPIDFRGKINDDVTSYVSLSNKGELFFTVTKLCMTQKQTQQAKGGMTEAYRQLAGYNKPFETIIFSPQAVRISTLGTSHLRFHHFINWNACAPKILNERWKK